MIGDFWKPTQLICPDGTRTGSVTVSFSAPDGEVSGPGTVTLNANGRVTISVTIRQHSIPPEYNDWLFPFLQGAPPRSTTTGGTIFRSSGTQKIRCLDVRTGSGVFRAGRALISRTNFSMGTSEETVIEVVPTDLEFVPGDAKSEDIWYMPLYGNLGEFVGTETACHVADRAPYIPFRADGYECGVHILEKDAETQENEFSGIAFGDIGPRPHQTVSEVTDLLPDGLIAALSFAAGSDISAPWIELRNFEGHLGRRLHVRFGGDRDNDDLPAFTRFDSSKLASGVGPFLNSFFCLPKDERHSLVVPMKLARRGTPGNATVDDSVTALVKALDALCKRHGLSRTNLRAGLDSQESAQVDSILNGARDDLKLLRRQWKSAGKVNQLAILDRIISRQANVATDDLDFGIAVAGLLLKVGLFDCDAMNSYYSKLPGDITWQGVLSYVRGQVVHSGAIRVQSSGELLPWFELSRHLHDLCKRIFFREVGYQGTYSPSNVLWQGQYEIDRVKPTTSARELGYTHPPSQI